MRAPDCGAAFACVAAHDERVLRRLQVAAREGKTWGVLWRRPGQRASASAAPLRLALAPRLGKLTVRVLKRRGAELPQPVLIDLADASSAIRIESSSTRHGGPERTSEVRPRPPAAH